MTNTASTQELEELIRRSLAIADAAGAAGVGIALNAALIELTGRGIAPRQTRGDR